MSAVERKARLERMIANDYRLIWRVLRRLGVPADGADDATQQVFNALTGMPVDKDIALVEPLVTKDTIDSPDVQKVVQRVYPPSAGAYLLRSRIGNACRVRMRATGS